MSDYSIKGERCIGLLPVGRINTNSANQYRMEALKDQLIKRRYETIEKCLETALKSYLNVDKIELSEEIQKRCKHYTQPSKCKEWWTIDGVTILECKRKGLDESFTTYTRKK